MDFDSIIRDAHDKGLITFHREDLMSEMVRDTRNWGRINLALANSVIDRRFRGLDFIDFYLVYREPMN